MDNLRGITLMLAAMAGFALEDMFIKAVAVNLPVGQVLLTLGLGGTLIFALWTYLRGERIFVREMAHPLMILRNLGELVGTFMFITALTRIPLGAVSAILQAAPLAVTLGAASFLGAPVGWRRWLAILVGFAGVLMVVRPGLAGFQPASLLAVGAVFALAARDLCTRIAPARVSSPLLSTWGFAMAGFAGAAMLPFGSAVTMPSSGQWLALAGALVAGVGGYYAITSAMRVGEVAVVTPFRYARLVFALFIGVLVFGEIPDRWTLAGAILIIGSGLYTIARERRMARTESLRKA